MMRRNSIDFPSIEPARTYNNSSGIHIEGELLTEILRHPICIEGIADICGLITMRIFPVEDIIRRDRDEINPERATRLRERVDSECIHIIVHLHAHIFRVIDCGIRSTVQEYIRRMCMDTLEERLERCDITLFFIGKDDLIFFSL